MRILILTNNDVGLYKFRKELIEELLKNEFPKNIIKRFDTDTIKNERILKTKEIEPNSDIERRLFLSLSIEDHLDKIISFQVTNLTDEDETTF